MLELPNKSPAVWQRFFDENRSLVYRYIVKQVKLGIENNLDKVALFTFKDSPKENWAYASEYEKILKDAMKVFVKEEEYESASKTKKLIDKLYINKLIKESNEV